MEQYFWYSIGVSVLFFALINKLVRGYIKDSDNKLKTFKEEYEKKNASMLAHFNREFLKLKFEVNNKPKYSVGDKLLNDSVTILDFCIAESDPYISDSFKVYFNRYEVFDSNKKVKYFIFEKELIELIKKATL